MKRGIKKGILLAAFVAASAVTAFGQEARIELGHHTEDYESDVRPESVDVEYSAEGFKYKVIEFTAESIKEQAANQAGNFVFTNNNASENVIIEIDGDLDGINNIEINNAGLHVKGDVMNSNVTITLDRSYDAELALNGYEMNERRKPFQKTAMFEADYIDENSRVRTPGQVMVEVTDKEKVTRKGEQVTVRQHRLQ